MFFFFLVLVTVPPLYVLIQGLNHPLISGVRTQISCIQTGARPPPQIVWNKGGIVMRGAAQTVIIYLFNTFFYRIMGV